MNYNNRRKSEGRDVYGSLISVVASVAMLLVVVMNVGRSWQEGRFLAVVLFAAIGVLMVALLQAAVRVLVAPWLEDE